jgi:hypothetical protein
MLCVFSIFITIIFLLYFTKKPQMPNKLSCMSQWYWKPKTEPFCIHSLLADETVTLFLSYLHPALLIRKYFTGLGGCLTFISSRRKSTRLIMFRQAIVRLLTTKEGNKQRECMKAGIDPA